MNVEDALTALPRCPTCSVPQVGDDCLYCRVVEVEAKLARVSFWGTDDWMQKLASLAIREERNPDRLHPMGFYQDMSSVQTGAIINVVSRPQISCRPVWLTVAPECAGMGSLLDVRVGNRSQLVDATAMPLSLFCPNAWESLEMMREVAAKMSFDTCSVAMDIVLTVDLSLQKYDPVVELAHETMYGPRPSAFKAIMWCRLVDDERQWAPQLHWAGPQNVGEVEATLKFADVVKKIRMGAL